MIRKDFFYFSRTERQGIIILAVLIILVHAASWFIPEREMPRSTDTENFEKEYTAFITSLQEQQHPKKTHNQHPFRKREVILNTFDPNTADSSTFISLGLPPWMAHNILRYRTKGGKFRKKEDFRKIYGLTEDQYTTLLPYICITETFSKRDTIRLLTHPKSRDSLHSYKYPAGTIISLNHADTTELKKIPGIGSTIARMIVAYRKRLGGFYTIEQLQDINLSVEILRPWFSININETQRINLNKAGIEQLKAHPYFNFYQAKAIVEYRKKKGSLKSLQPFKLFEEFSEKDFERMSPYIRFD